MENSFEVLQWESTSKEQDSLVDQLFGEISDSAARKTSASGSLSDKTSKLTSKREKRKALDNEKSPEKAKRKLKDKREKNKFKADKKCNSHHPEFSADQSETAVCLACDENVTSVKETNKGVSINGTNQINQSKKGKRKSSHDDKSAGKLEKKRKDKKKKNKFKSDEKLDSQLTGVNEGVSVDGINTSEQDVLVDFGMPLEAESDPHKSGQESVEPKRNKAKKKRRKEKSTEDDADSDHELPDLGQSTLRAKHKHKRMKTEKEHEQGCSEPTKNHSECLKSQDKNVTSVPQKKSSLHEKMTKQLESSRFRWINEQLYTTTGDEAMAMFSNNPRLFDVYHWGFSNQVKLWPINPVNKIIEWLKKR